LDPLSYIVGTPDEFARPIQFPWNSASVRSLLRNPRFVADLSTYRDQARNALCILLREHEFDTQGSNVIVDIGWRGTIQDNIARAFPTTQIFGIYMGLQKFLNTQPSNVRKHALIADINAGNNRFADILNHVRPMEMLCNSSGGSVTSYEIGENGAAVVKTQ